jgi:hypothetical protein
MLEFITDYTNIGAAKLDLLILLENLIVWGRNTRGNGNVDLTSHNRTHPVNHKLFISGYNTVSIIIGDQKEAKQREYEQITKCYCGVDRCYNADWNGVYLYGGPRQRAKHASVDNRNGHL